MNKISVGTKIRTLRTLRGMYQAELAKKSGINRPTIVAIETDKVLPGPEHTRAIEAVLGLRLNSSEVEAAFSILAKMNDIERQVA